MISSGRLSAVRQELATPEHMLNHGQPIDQDAAHILFQFSNAVVSTVMDGEVQPEAQSTGLNSTGELSLHLFTNPILAALRSTNAPVSPSSVNSPHILFNAKCSGYFVEPVSPQDY